MAKLTLSVSKKIGGPAFSSTGAHAEIEIDLAPKTTADLLVQIALTNYAVLTGMVDVQLAKPTAQTDRGSHDHMEGQNGKLAGQGAHDQVEDQGEGEHQDDRPGDPSRDGVSLLHWASDNNCKQQLFNLGKTLELPRRFRDWSRDDAARVYKILSHSCRNANSKIPF
jgi:hypothetical protein